VPTRKIENSIKKNKNPEEVDGSGELLGVQNEIW
jgi:hypothetical protein